jgi:hypothetical protein
MAGLKYPLSLVIRAVDGVTKPLAAINEKLEKSGGRISAPFERLTNRLGALGKAAGVPALAGALGRTGDAAGVLGSRLAGVGTMFAGLATVGAVGLTSLVKGALDAGDRIGELAQRVGLAVDVYASLEHAAAQADVAPEAFAAAMDRFNKGLGEMRAGSGPFISFLGKVGPGLLTQVKASKSTEEALSLVTDAFAKIEDPARRAALASALFGKSGLQMGQFLGQGSAEIQKQQLRFMALAGSQEELVRNSGELDNALRETGVALLGVRNVAAGALMPAITSLAMAVTGFIVKNRDGIQKWAEKTGAAIQGWIDGGGVERLVNGLGRLADAVTRAVDRVGGMENALGLVALAMAGPSLLAAGRFAFSLAGVGKEVLLLGVRLGGVLLGALGRAGLAMLAFNFAPLLAGLRAASAATWSFTTSLLANPVVLVAGLMAAAAYLIYTNWKPIAGFFGSIWTEISYEFRYMWETLKIWGPKIWTGIVDSVMSIWTPVAGFFTGLWGGIVSTFEEAWAAIAPIADKLMLAAQFLPGFGGAVGVATGARALLSGGVEGKLGAAQALGAASALPPAVAGGTAAVRVEFANMPRGARVSSESDGAPLSLDLGYSLAPGT